MVCPFTPTYQMRHNALLLVMMELVRRAGATARSRTTGPTMGCQGRKGPSGYKRHLRRRPADAGRDSCSNLPCRRTEDGTDGDNAGLRNQAGHQAENESLQDHRRPSRHKVRNCRLLPLTAQDARHPPHSSTLSVGSRQQHPSQTATVSLNLNTPGELTSHRQSGVTQHKLRQ
jgi:hypothetical protein